MSTLVPKTTVTTNTTPINKSGTSCSGTSMGGALQAVDPTWSGYVDPGYGQQLDVIKGENHAFSTNTYWSLYVNGDSATAGICSTELQPGDDVLIYALCAGSSTNCTNGEPLVATAPATATPGVPLTVSVTESTTDSNTYVTTKGPAAGATVAGGGLSAKTGSDGKATLTATNRGPLDLLVTKPDRVRQALAVCVTDGADGFCGTTKPGDPPPAVTPGPPPAPCQTTGSDGFCGTTDKAAPVAAIRGGLKEQATFTRATAPSTLGGTVAADAAGLKDVRLRLTRTVGPRCSYLDGELERLVTSKVCGVAGGRFFSIGDKSAWSYLLPFRLPAGRYVLDVQTVDRAGNVSTISARGRDRIVFVVK